MFDDIKSPDVQELLLEAKNNALALLTEKPGHNQRIRTIVNPIAGIKKRAK